MNMYELMINNPEIGQYLATIELPILEANRSNDTLDNPTIGGFDDFPDSVVIIEYSGGRHAVYCVKQPEEIHGVACFSNEGRAVLFTERVSVTGGKTVTMSFDDAREIAKSKSAPIVALILVDDWENPKVHFVR